MIDGYKRVLIIEDDLEYRKRLGDFLSARGCDVSVADDGPSAMEKLLFHKPHLIILDLLLPGLDGFGVLERIRAYPEKEMAETPVIVLSNLSSEEDVQKATSFNVVAYCVKSHTTFDE